MRIRILVMDRKALLPFPGLALPRLNKLPLVFVLLVFVELGKANRSSVGCLRRVMENERQCLGFHETGLEVMLRAKSRMKIEEIQCWTEEDESGSMGNRSLVSARQKDLFRKCAVCLELRWECRSHWEM